MEVAGQARGAVAVSTHKHVVLRRIEPRKFARKAAHGDVQSMCVHERDRLPFFIELSQVNHDHRAEFGAVRANHPSRRRLFSPLVSHHCGR